MPFPSILVLLTLQLHPQAVGSSPPGPPPEACVALVEGLFPGTYSHQGSGVVVAPGILATNAHVVVGASVVRIRKDDQTWETRDYCVEPDLDLCLLRIPGLTMPVATLGTSADLDPGQPVLSIGYPGAKGPRTHPGTLVSTWRFRGDHLLQANALIQPGSSGGGLFSADGKLLGITTFMLSDAGLASFSVPITWVRGLLSGDAGAGQLVCRRMSMEEIQRSFVDNMTADPENWPSWGLLARTWIQDSPGNPDAWYAQGIALMLRSQGLEEGTLKVREEAAAAFRKAVDLKPDFARAWNNLGIALASLNAFEGGEQALERAVQLSPGYASAWLNLGSVQMEAKQFEQAVQSLGRGLALQPDDTLGWSRLAYCEAALGRWEEAAGHYRVALGHRPFQAEWVGEMYRAYRQAGNQEAAAKALARLKVLNPALAKSLAARNP